MTDLERKRYEGTGHGGSLESRLLAFRQATTPRVITICAWCETTPPATAHVIYTHGVCTDCKARVEREG